MRTSSFNKLQWRVSNLFFALNKKKEMGNINTVPVISQIKSAVEACGGDLEAASRTQEEFSRKCIVVSQIRSAVEAGLGNFEAALETQIVFASEIDKLRSNSWKDQV